LVAKQPDFLWRNSFHLRKTIVVVAAFVQWLLAAGGDSEERKREDT
jgi:hypothetical protein